MVAHPGTRRDHDRFCRAEGWDAARDSRGRPVQHHITYQLRLDDGRILRTRISRPADATTYGPRLWRHILAEQLEVTEDEFWVCVHDGVRPDRRREPTQLPENALPAGLVHQLLRAGVTEDVIADMTLEQATAAMTAFWSRPRDQL